MNRIRNKYKWYMVACISGKEKHVIDALTVRMKKTNKESKKEEIVIKDMYLAIIPHKTPMGKIRERNLFPGYIFIYMNMTDDGWFMIRNTEYVTGLVGSSGKRTKPTPISNSQIENVKKQVAKIKVDVKNDFESTKDSAGLKVGDNVVIVKGEMTNQVGQLSSISVKAKKVLVDIEIFGKMVPTEFTINSVRKIND